MNAKETNIKEMTVDQLKALAYDQIVAREVAEMNLRAINQEIQLRLSQKPALKESDPV